MFPVLVLEELKGLAPRIREQSTVVVRGMPGSAQHPRENSGTLNPYPLTLNPKAARINRNKCSGPRNLSTNPPQRPFRL